VKKREEKNTRGKISLVFFALENGPIFIIMLNLEKKIKSASIKKLAQPLFVYRIHILYLDIYIYIN